MPDGMIELALDDGWQDAFVAGPQAGPARPPVVLLPDGQGLTESYRVVARRLAAHGYFVLAPDWTRRRSEDRRDDAEAWLDWLAGERAVDDDRIAVVGYGDGADLALRVAAWRAERVAAVGAFLGRGLRGASAHEVAQRLNAVVHLGHGGAPPPGAADLHGALRVAGVDFEVAAYPDATTRTPSCEAQWAPLLDLLGRALAARAAGRAPGVAATGPRA